MGLIRNRISAFLIDMVLVFAISLSLSNLSYLNPYIDNYATSSKEFQEVYSEYLTTLTPDTSGKLDINETYKFMYEKLIPLQMKVEKYNIFYILWYLIIYFLYFVLFAYYTEGQTLGKKLFRIKVVDKDDSKVSFKKLLIRSIFNGSSLVMGLNLLCIIKIFLSFITNIQLYYYSYFIFELLAFGFEVSLVIVFLVKKGYTSTADLLAKTKVIEVK